MDGWGDGEVDRRNVQFSRHLFPRNSQIFNIIMCRYVVPDFLQIEQQVLVRVEHHFLSRETMASTLPILRNSRLIDAFFLHLMYHVLRTWDVEFRK